MKIAQVYVLLATCAFCDISVNPRTTSVNVNSQMFGMTLDQAFNTTSTRTSTTDTIQ